ncbi:MAG: M23 family metallopeptidase [Clostridium sp.]|nr:M23 family metallopeptidase [Clostridium sp.]
MGHYNSEYESYYNSIINKRNSSNNYFRGSQGREKNKNWIVKRLIQELCGVLVMVIFVLVCKFIVTPQTVSAYKYSKNIVNSNYDYKGFINKVKTVDTSENIQDKAVELIDKVKSNFTGGETIKEKIRDKFTLPANGNIMSEEDNGIVISTNLDGKVSASFDGKVKECGEDAKLGKYILIDHGEGLETVYSNLDNIVVNEKDIVRKGEVIAENKTQKEAVHFEVLFMGQNKGLERIVGKKD